MFLRELRDLLVKLRFQLRQVNIRMCVIAVRSQHLQHDALSIHHLISLESPGKFRFKPIQQIDSAVPQYLKGRLIRCIGFNL